MQPDPIRAEETAAWLRKSCKDLWRAENVLTLNPPDTEDCLFHCQQAVEKSQGEFALHKNPLRLYALTPKGGQSRKFLL